MADRDTCAARLSGCVKKPPASTLTMPLAPFGRWNLLGARRRRMCRARTTLRVLRFAKLHLPAALLAHLDHAVEMQNTRRQDARQRQRIPSCPSRPVCVSDGRGNWTQPADTGRANRESCQEHGPDASSLSIDRHVVWHRAAYPEASDTTVYSSPQERRKN